MAHHPNPIPFKGQYPPPQQAYPPPQQAYPPQQGYPPQQVQSFPQYKIFTT